MGLILCGGRTDMEIHAKRDMIVDSLNSVKMAMEFGMLPAGGCSLYHASKLLNHVHLEN